MKLTFNFYYVYHYADVLERGLLVHNGGRCLNGERKLVNCHEGDMKGLEWALTKRGYLKHVQR